MIGITNMIVVMSALSHATGWAMLKPDNMGGGEMEAHKADHVEWPSENGRKVTAGKPVNY